MCDPGWHILSDQMSDAGSVTEIYGLLGVAVGDGDAEEDEAGRDCCEISRGLDGGNAVGSFCGAIDSFDKGDAAAAFETVAGRGAILLDGGKEVF